MRFLTTMLASLFNLSFKIRLSIVVLSFLICLALFTLLFPASHNGSSLVIPIVLAAWLFKQRGMLIILGCTLLALIVVNSITIGGILWPQPLFVSFITGSLSLLVVGLSIGFLRHALDMAVALDLANTARLKAEQAEREIARAYKQQRQVNELKDQLLLNINHELRTPLTELLGYLELLRESNGQFDSVTQMTFLNNALRGGEELQSLIGNVLDSMQAATDTEPLRLEKLPVAKVMNEVLELFDPRKLQDHMVSMDIPEELMVWADRQYVHRVMRNLLSNAFKYSPKHTPVIIHASLCDSTDTGAHASSQVCISVKDAGLGISPSEIPLLFGKFVRLKRDLSGSVRGTGLGLYISKRLVEAVGGSIWVESTGIPGQGSCFFLTLPAPPYDDLRVSVDSHSTFAKVQSHDFRSE